MAVSMRVGQSQMTIKTVGKSNGKKDRRRRNGMTDGGRRWYHFVRRFGIFCLAKREKIQATFYCALEHGMEVILEVNTFHICQ